jgi:hypothetical protein
MKILKVAILAISLIASVSAAAKETATDRTYSDSSKEALYTDVANAILNNRTFSAHTAPFPHRTQLSKEKVRSLYQNRLPEDYISTLMSTLRTKHSIVDGSINAFSLYYVTSSEIVDIQLCWLTVANNKKECLLSDKSNVVLEQKADSTYGAAFVLQKGIWFGYADGDLLFKRTSPQALTEQISDAWSVMSQQLKISNYNADLWAAFF